MNASAARLLPSWLDLAGRRGLVVGIANEHSIAWGCAVMLRQLGAELAVTYLNPKAEPHVRPLAERVDASIVTALDVEVPGQIESLFGTIAREWGRLDFVVHAIAFAPRECLHGRAIDCQWDNFARAMRVSVHSLVRMARLADPLMQHGGAIVTMSYVGAERAVQGYGVMGPVKATLEAFVRELAIEMAPRGVRVYAVSPGPIRTRAASGIPEFESLARQAVARSPQHRLVSVEEVGRVVAALVSDAGLGTTGNTIHVDGGYHVVG